MKKMKRLVAVLLVGIMALAMLTACGVTPSAPSMRDTALERDVAKWTVELGNSQKLTLTLDPELTEISNKCLPTAVKAVDARLTSPIDTKAYFDAVEKRETFFAEAKKGKTAALVPVDFSSEEEVTKDTLAHAYAALRPDIQSNLEQAGVMNPTKFGVTVTKQKEYTLVLFVVSQ
jgi:ABC-type transport system substrate-binding protein